MKYDVVNTEGEIIFSSDCLADCVNKVYENPEELCIMQGLRIIEC